MKQLIARLRGYRTFIIGLFAGIAPAWDTTLLILHQLAMDPDLPKLIPAAWQAPYAFAVSVVMIYMRLKTSTAPGRRD